MEKNDRFIDVFKTEILSLVFTSDASMSVVNTLLRLHMLLVLMAASLVKTRV